jgi:hypothetical protein
VALEVSVVEAIEVAEEAVVVLEVALAQVPKSSLNPTTVSPASSS